MAAGIAAVLLKTNVHSRAFPNPRVCCLSHKLVSEPDAAAENKHVLLLTKELVRRSRKKQYLVIWLQFRALTSLLKELKIMWSQKCVVW